MKFKQLTSIFTVVLFSAFMAGCGGGSSDNSIKPTKAMYDQITIGMPYAQVVAIVGGEGVKPELAWSSEKVAETRTWSHGSTPPNYHRLQVCIPNGNVVTKFYEGLETNGKGIAEGDSKLCI